MPEKNANLQTWLVLSAALAAIIGAVVGGFTALSLSSTFSLQVGAVGEEQINDQVMEARIVELIEEESATIAVVEQVTPAVVSIVVKQSYGDLVSSESSGRFFSPFFYPIELSEEESEELIETSSGTGFFVTKDGFVLTNRHVVDEVNASYFVVTSDGEELPAMLVDIDPFQDIAILDVEGENFETVNLADSDMIRIGQTVIAIGNTLSEFRNTVTKGVVSGINRRVTAGTSNNAEVIEQAIQTDAAINPGNSGGPLINLLGEVIGINTAVSYEGESVAFAIPINDAKRSIEDVQNFGRIVRPWLGVRYVLVVPEDLEDMGAEYEVGAMIIEGDQPGQPAIFDGSPADLAGLEENDIILAVDGDFLTPDKGLAEMLSEYRPGDIIALEILRESTLLEVLVTLAEYDESTL